MTFIMLTRLGPEMQARPLDEMEREVMEQIRLACPQVEWSRSYAVMGGYDYFDIFEAPDLSQALRVSVIMRRLGHTHAEVWPAMAWQEFKSAMGNLETGRSAVPH